MIVLSFNMAWRHCVVCVCFFLLEEKFAQAVSFLLVDLYLLTFQPEKALHLLAVLDKLSAQGSSKNNKGEVLLTPHTPTTRPPDSCFLSFFTCFVKKLRFDVPGETVTNDSKTDDASHI